MLLALQVINKKLTPVDHCTSYWKFGTLQVQFKIILYYKLYKPNTKIKDS